MKKRMNKILPILLVSMSSLLASCQVMTGETTSDIKLPTNELEKIMQKYDDLGYEYSYEGEPVTLTMSHWDSAGANVEKTVVEAVLQGFKKRYPTINVKLEIVQSYETVYGNYIGSGQAHDVFLVPDGSISAWASSGKLMNLSPYIAASTLIDENKMYSSCLTRYQYNPQTGRMGSGNQLALPKDVGPYVMYYNKDWFKKQKVALPPSDRIMTMDEATEMWKALTKKNAEGVITGYGVAGLGIEGLVWSAGGDFLNEDRTAFPTDEKTIAGLKKGYQYMKDSYLKDFTQPPATFTGTADASSLFTQQKVATVISGRWDVTSFRSLSFDWDVTYVPAFEENPTKNMYSGSVGYAVNAKSKNTEAGWKLVEYIASREGQEILTSTGFQIPVYEDLALEESLVASEKAKGPENYEIFVESAKMQGYGLWQYRSNTLWKVNGYDTPSEYLYSTDPATEITVDEFIEQARQKVTENLN